jgi:hypothetical protein
MPVYALNRFDLADNDLDRRYCVLFAEDDR